MLKFYGFITERLFIMVLKMQYGRQRGTYMCTYLSRHKYENIEPKRFAQLAEVIGPSFGVIHTSS